MPVPRKKRLATTQIQFFRDRLENDHIGLLLFPILVGLVVPYLLIGVISAGIVVSGVLAEINEGMGPELTVAVACDDPENFQRAEAILREAGAEEVRDMSAEE